MTSPLDRLTDFLVEDIMAATDEEILAETIEDGDDPETSAAELRATFDRLLAEQEGKAK